MHKRVVVANLADTHAGHRLGLCNPDTRLVEEGPDGQTKDRGVALGPTQEYLWDEVYQPALKETEDFTAGDDLIVVHDGDLTWGSKHIEESPLSVQVDEQIDIAHYNLKPWTEIPGFKAMRLVIGTGAHTFDGASEPMVAKLMRSEGRDDVKAVSHLLLNVNGVDLDIAHHGPPPGVRRYLEGNSARLYLSDIMDKCLDEGVVPPRVVVRAHQHTWIPHFTVGKMRQGKFYESTLVMLPSLCGLTGYARKVTKSVFQQTHGIVLFEIVNGYLTEIRPIIKVLDLRTKEAF